MANNVAQALTASLAPPDTFGPRGWVLENEPPRKFLRLRPKALTTNYGHLCDHVASGCRSAIRPWSGSRRTGRAPSPGSCDDGSKLATACAESRDHLWAFGYSLVLADISRPDKEPSPVDVRHRALHLIRHTGTQASFQFRGLATIARADATCLEVRTVRARHALREWERPKLRWCWR